MEIPTYLFDPTPEGVLSLIVTALLPIAAAFVMKQSWGNPQKGLVLLVVAAVKQFVEAWILALHTGAHFNYWGVAYGIVANFLIAVASYFGIWKGSSLQQTAINSGPIRDRTVEGSANT